MNDRPQDPRQVRPGDAHPRELLADYLLDELPAPDRAAVAAHLKRCEGCRGELARMDEAFVAAVEGLPAEDPPERVWAGIRARVHDGASPAAVAEGARAEDRPGPRPTRRAEDRPAAARPLEPQAGSVPGHAGPEPTREVRRTSRSPRAPWMFAVAASLALAVVVGAWGMWQRQQVQTAEERLADAQRARIEAEAEATAAEARAEALAEDQARIARWMAQDVVTLRRLEPPDEAGADAPSQGAVLFLPDGRALVVMRDVPAEGRDYQAWGVVDDEVTALGTFSGQSIEVPADAFEVVGVSVEPAGGSDTPSDMVGYVSTG